MENQSNSVPMYDGNGSLTFPQQQTPRKRPRQADLPVTDPEKLALKREKARERQRRKRAKDKAREISVKQASSSSFTEVASSSTPSTSAPVAGPSTSTVSQPTTPDQTPARNEETNFPLTPEEQWRRDKIRAAARERQRKHRALVKQRKMAELGIPMTPDGVGNVEEVHYSITADGYQVVPPPHGNSSDQPALQGTTGGQLFASTLLLSFSCSPLLKQHLLRTLHMSNEELASLEPILSAAWDHWDHARRVHYAEQAAKGSSGQNGNGVTNGSHPPFTPPPGVDVQSNFNDFRARFHRPLTAPSPFRSATTVSAIAAIPQSLLQHSSGTTIDPNLSSNATDNATHSTSSASVTAEQDAEDGSGSEIDVEADLENDKDEIESSSPPETEKS